MILFNATLQLVGWGFAIHTSIFLGGFLLCYLFFLIKNSVKERHQFAESIQKAIFFGAGVTILPLILLAWLVHSGVTLQLLFFNIFDVPSYDTSVMYHNMLMKVVNATLFMIMNPLLSFGLILYFTSAIKAFFSEKLKTHCIDNLIGLFVVVGMVSIIVLPPKIYPPYLIDIAPFMAIGAARAFYGWQKTKGVEKTLELKSTKISTKLHAHRARILLFGLCIFVIVSGLALYEPIGVYYPANWNDEYKSTQAVVNYIRTHTQPDEKIFTIDHMFAALAPRRIVGDVSTGIQIRSAWHLDGFPYASPQEIINLMRKGEGKYVIMDPNTSRALEKWTPDLFDYIMNAYTVEKVIEDIEIMGRAS